MDTTHNFEMKREVGEAFMSNLVAEALALVYEEPGATSSGASMTEIQNNFPTRVPRVGHGPEAFVRLVQASFSTHIRNYRHRLHFGHQRPAPSLASAAADLLSGVTNTTVSVFEAGPFSVALENTVQKWIQDLFGLPEKSMVTFTHGGSESTLTAFLCARERRIHQVPDEDWRDACVVAGDHAHYCVERSARVVGIRPDRIMRVPVDRCGRISVSDLRRTARAAKRAGHPVLAIAAAAGTTACGAFDDLIACGDIAREYDAWFHVDASHGGAAVFDETFRAKLAGLDRVDSFCWNPHKLMWVSPPCACLMVRDRTDLRRALSMDLARAYYILDKASSRRDDGDTSDTGEQLEWTLSCTRQFSAFKVFASAYIYGTDTIGHRLVSMCRLARNLATLLRRNPRFDVYCDPEFNIVCFRYVTGGDADEFNRKLRTRLAAKDECYLTGTEIDGRYWLRAQFTSETTKSDDLRTLIGIIEREAQGMSSRSTPSQLVGA